MEKSDVKINYKLGEIKEIDFEILSLLNFIDWFAPSKDVNNDLSKKVRHIANEIDYIDKQAKEIIKECLQVMFVEGETYNPLQLDFFKKAKRFLGG